VADTFQKQVTGKAWCAFDFAAACANIIPPGNPDTLLSYTLKAYLEGVDVTADVLGRTDFDGPNAGLLRIETWHFRDGYFVYFLASGGVAGLDYQWECNAETSSGQVIPLDATMKVIPDR